MNKSLDLKKLLLIINPVTARAAVTPALIDVIDCFEKAGYRVSVHVTQYKNDTFDTVKQIGGDYDTVVCAGGDGTLNECVSGLAQAGLQRPLGYIPCGSTNDFAASHGLSDNIPLEAKRIAEGGQKRYDVGCFDERFFLHHALFGAFTWMAYSTDQEQKNKLGYGAYVLDGFRGLSKLKPYRLKLTADGAEIEDEFLFGAVSTNRYIAGIFELPDQIIGDDDGKLAVVLIRVPKNMLEWDTLAHSILTGDPDCPMVKILFTKDVTVESEEGIEWSLDGESSGLRTSAHITTKQAFLNLQG